MAKFPSKEELLKMSHQEWSAWMGVAMTHSLRENTKDMPDTPAAP